MQRLLKPKCSRKGAAKGSEPWTLALTLTPALTLALTLTPTLALTLALAAFGRR